MGEKTIAAISTPLGTGGVSMIRVSGEKAIEIADKCFKPFSNKSLLSFGGYEAAYGELRSGDEVIDDCVALVFRAPKSYTGEDVVEITVHGGTLVTKKALRCLLDCGAVSAGAGEFTKRAFLNGKMDLTKAESVISIINAKNDAALRQSRKALDGAISSEIGGVLDRLLETAASIAAYSDFPDEDIENLNPENFSALLKEATDKLNRLISGFDSGRIIREGIDCAILGKPNVGKSTLMNVFSKSERSIVTDIAGTTRDVIEGTVNISGITLNLADTAGIRETEDTVEKMGVSRAIERGKNCDIVLAVFDMSSPLDNDDKKVLSSLDKEKSIVVLNKSDLKNEVDIKPFEGCKTVMISAKDGTGVDVLCDEIKNMAIKVPLGENETVLITERQLNTAKRALAATKEAAAALKSGVTLDAVGVCLDDAVAALLELTGGRVTDEVCDRVFERFCIGK